jgi:bacteriorhodopsin
MDWFLTVPLLLVELVLVMRLEDGKTGPVCLKLGLAAALMIVLGYPGETSEKNGKRWLWWALAMLPFFYIIYTLFVGLKNATRSTPAKVSKLITIAQYTTIISWCTCVINTHYSFPSISTVPFTLCFTFPFTLCFTIPFTLCFTFPYFTRRDRS